MNILEYVSFTSYPFDFINSHFHFSEKVLLSSALSQFPISLTKQCTASEGRKVIVINHLFEIFSYEFITSVEINKTLQKR